jgi:hypothetical protein
VAKGKRTRPWKKTPRANVRNFPQSAATSAEESGVTSSTYDDSPRRAWRHGVWTPLLAATLMLLVAWGVHAAFALPSSPATIWAEVSRRLDVKWWAQVRLTPDGERLPVGGIAQFETSDGRSTDAWQPTMLIEFECPTPLARQALQQLLRGAHDSWSAVAVYHPSGETTVGGGKTWARYVRED